MVLFVVIYCLKSYYMVITNTYTFSVLGFSAIIGKHHINVFKTYDIFIIIAFNIFGSLTMLIIEKQDDIETFRSLGATDRMLRKTFTLEGWLISLLGLACGLAVGILFALLQQKFGFIKMPGSFLVNAYPVILQWSDILLTILGVALIGYLIARLPVRRNITSSRSR